MRTEAGVAEAAFAEKTPRRVIVLDSGPLGMLRAPGVLDRVVASNGASGEFAALAPEERAYIALLGRGSTPAAGKLAFLRGMPEPSSTGKICVLPLWTTLEGIANAEAVRRIADALPPENQ